MVKGKIAIRKINCSKSRQVTFFKRRTGLMKKAKELSILCDAEIGVIIFSCTGKPYDYASTSMNSVIERYNKVKLDDQQQSITAAEIQFLQTEMESLKQQLRCLQECNRRLMGEELSKLGLEDLKSLENVLEMGLKNVRSRKFFLLFICLGPELHGRNEGAKEKGGQRRTRKCTAAEEAESRRSRSSRIRG